MPNPGDEWAAGDIPPEPEMTPERLRLMANRRKMRGDPATAFVLRDLASAWEADRKERDELRRRVIERMERNRELNTRIEELERERDHYRSNVDRWAEEIAVRDARIEELEEKCCLTKDVWESAEREVTELRTRVKMLEKEKEAILEELPDSMELRLRIVSRLAALAPEEEKP